MSGRSRLGSIAMIMPSVTVTIVVSVAMDALLQRRGDGGCSDCLAPAVAPAVILTSAILFNITTLLQSLTGAVIEWRRPGHLIGRLLMISGPLYALLAAGWLTGDTLGAFVDPRTYRILNWAGGLLSWPGVALIAGWLPLLFPSGSLPGPRWRLPAVAIAGIGTAGVVAIAIRPGEIGVGSGLENPFAIGAWPPVLQLLVDGVPIALIALMILAGAGLAARYRRGDRVERLQVRWLLGAISIVVAGFVGVVVEIAVRTDEGPLLSAIVAYVGILLMPIAIGIAILRYRLYEIDRIISRTLAYAALTGALAVVYGAAFLALQAVLAPLTSNGGSLAVAASTLAVFALFQPLRRRLQSTMDRRFNRSRYDAQQTIESFAGQLRDEVDLERLGGEIRAVVGGTLAPASIGVWLRQSGHGADR